MNLGTSISNRTFPPIYTCGKFEDIGQFLVCVSSSVVSSLADVGLEAKNGYKGPFAANDLL